MAKTKILILGSDEIWSLDKIYFKHLLKMDDLDVTFFAAENIFSDFYNHSLVNKLLFKLELSAIYKKVSSATKKAINTFKPDIIWVFKGMSILSELLIWAKDQGIMLVNFNADHPFIFSSKGSGNQNVTQSIGLYDLHLSYNRNVLEEISKRFSSDTAYLPFGYEIPEQVQLNNDQNEINKLCFIGNPDNLRVNLLINLLDAGIQIDIYGNNWKNYIKHQNLTIYQPIYGDEMWTTIKKYRVQLNVMREHNINSHNMRSFEIPGAGGIMLAPYTIEHESFFEKQKECFFYHTTDDCIKLTNEILTLSSANALEIRNNAQKRSIESRYTYKDRANQAIQFIKNTYES